MGHLLYCFFFIAITKPVIAPTKAVIAPINEIKFSNMIFFHLLS